MKKKLLALVLCGAMAFSLAACGAKKDDAAAKSKSEAAAVEKAVEAVVEEAVVEEVAEAVVEEVAEEVEEAVDEAASEDRCTDTWLRANWKDLCGDEKAEGKKVGFTLISLGNDFMLYLSKGIEEAFKAEGVEVQTDACDGDPTKQQEQIENYVTMGKDLIIIFPVNGEACQVAAEAAEAAGIPVIAFAMDIPSEKLTCHVISAEEDTMGYAAGKMAAEWANKNLADKDEINVLLVGSTSSPELSVRSEAEQLGFEENCELDFNLVRDDTPDSNKVEEGLKKAENMWLGGKTWDVVIAVNQQTAIGFNQYMVGSDAPLKDVSKFAIFCVDETEEVIENIKASKENKSTLRGTISMGAIEDTVDVVHSAAMPILTGGEVITHVDGDAIPITADDVK